MLRAGERNHYHPPTQPELDRPVVQGDVRRGVGKDGVAAFGGAGGAVGESVEVTRVLSK